MRVVIISHGILAGAMLERPCATASIHVSTMKLQHSYCDMLAFNQDVTAKWTYVAVIELPEALPAKSRGVAKTLLNHSVQE